ncbi:MAG: small acid-soluble spore protein SspI [Bacilli bacterium]|nr:small acid-soluble spore protein SspI [Bacilli bacterium]
MNIDIRKYIENNFKDATIDDIRQSIEESLKKGDDITLPGLGFFFEIIWNASDDNEKNNILHILLKHFK